MDFCVFLLIFSISLERCWIDNHGVWAGVKQDEQNSINLSILIESGEDLFIIEAARKSKKQFRLRVVAVSDAQLGGRCSCQDRCNFGPCFLLALLLGFVPLMFFCERGCQKVLCRLIFVCPYKRSGTKF